MSLIQTDAWARLRMGNQIRRPNLTWDQGDGKRLMVVRMVWFPLKVGWVRHRHKVYVMSDLCNKLILGEDWLRGRSAQLKFAPHTALTVGVEILKRGDWYYRYCLLPKRDIRLCPQIAMTCKGVIATKKGLEKGTYQVTPLESIVVEEEKVTLCEADMRDAETLPILIVEKY